MPSPSDDEPPPIPRTASPSTPARREHTGPAPARGSGPDASRISGETFNARVDTRRFDAAIQRAVAARYRALGEELRRLRADAGLTGIAVARAAGIDDAYLGRVEAGRVRASLETYERVAAILGADLSTRFYPNTGPAIRDHLSAPILERLLEMLDGRWRPFTEVAVRRPARGWIDAALHDQRARIVVATEIQSEMRRLEQLVRWQAEKAASLPSWDGWPALSDTPEISRLLIVRRTRATTTLARAYAQQLRVAYPAHPDDAQEALTTPHAAWPGASMVWAEVVGSKARLLSGR